MKGFYFRALRISSPLILNSEPNYIENSYASLQYPKSFIQRPKIKDFRIYKTEKLSKQLFHEYFIDILFNI